MSEPDANYWKDKLRELLKRVPARVNAGSHDVTVAYKDAVSFANKQLASSRATLMNLRQAAQRLQAYE